MPAATETHNVSSGRAWAQSAILRIRHSGSSALLFFVLLACACTWVLHLPVFPSQDGPVHVYYARVARDLMLGGQTYAQQFRLARPFPPYSIHAYVLMAMLPWASSEMAEKLLACLSMIVCGLGVLLLARRLGRSLIVCAFAVPLLLNRFLFLGFYGYTLAIGFALMAISDWLGDDRARPMRRASFLLLTVLALFSHPVPYLLLIAFCWLAVLSGWWNRRYRTSAESAVQAPTRGDLIVLTIATSFFIYIKHYSHSGMLWNYEWAAEWNAKLLRVVDVFRTWIILPVKAPSYSFALGAVVVGLTVVALVQARRESRSGSITRVQLVAGFALLLLFALPLLPRTMNGSGFFAERFAIWPPLLLIAASSAMEVRRSVTRVLGCVAVVVFALTLFLLNSYLAPIARAEDVSGVPAGILAGQRVLAHDESRAKDLTYEPYQFAPVRLVDRAGALLTDSPWTDLQIIMLDEIGPKARFTPEEGPRTLTTPPEPLGVVDSHCGVTGPSSAALFAERHPGRWQVVHHGCFDVVEPLR